MEKLPTYHEFLKDWSLVDKIKFHYDVDLGNFTGDWCEILADSIDNPNWLNEFYRGLEEDLREREYIR